MGLKLYSSLNHSILVDKYKKESLYKNGQDVLDMQYVYIIYNLAYISLQISSPKIGVYSYMSIVTFR